MRVVSLVPSLTETLIECGVNVVGRTRFCVHPRQEIQKIAVVGGTKDLDWSQFKDLRADLLVLDQEENLPWMKEQSPVPVHVTHVTSLQSLPEQLSALADLLQAPRLQEVARRWNMVSKQKGIWDWARIPGEIEKISEPSGTYEKLVYVIWKNPWMSVSRETFIGSVLCQLGAAEWLPVFDSKYPALELEKFDLKTTYFLFSSEPFPFHRKVTDLKALGLQGSVVDGEAYSWFGLRSLNFLEKELIGR